MTNICEKLRAVQVELHAPKNQKNSFGGYNYRSAEDILEAVKPVLNTHGLTLIVGDEVVQVGDRIYVKATATVLDGTDSVSATGYAREQAAKKGMDESQITGAASSYSRKYALNGLFAIDDSKDVDTDEARKQADSAPDPVQVKLREVTNALKWKNPAPDVVKAKVAELGFDGLSRVNTVEALDALSEWIEGL